MSEIKLVLSHAFGSICSRKNRNAIAICDEDKNEAKIVFPAGKCLAKKFLDRSEMEFVLFSENVQQIQFICISPTKSQMALAFKPFKSNLQLIRIHSFKTGEEPITLQIFHETEKVGNIQLLTFSASEPKFLCALLGEPHCKMVYIDITSKKALAQSAPVWKQIDKMTICPYNSHLIGVSGGSILKLFKVEEYTFKPLEDIKKLQKGRRITDHAWYKGKMLLIATEKCEIIVMGEGKQNLYQVKHEYSNVFNELTYDQMWISAICPFSKGFIVGSNNGKFALWTNKDEDDHERNEALQLSRKWATAVERAAEVTGLEMSSKEDILAISLANHDVATLYLNEILMQSSQASEASTDKQIVFEYLYKGFHNQAITGMDVCEQRPLVATCSREDSTIRIWNYKNYGCKMLRMFYFRLKEDNSEDKPLITLAFHPSGYYMAVGCTDRLRMFHVLNSQLRPYREVPVKNAHIVKFSKGGHLLAACFPFKEDSPIDHIKIYNAITLEEIITLNEHLSTIRVLQFKHYDESLLSISEEGQIIQWRVAGWNITKLIQREGVKFTSGMYFHPNNSIVVAGSEEGKRFLQEYGCDSNLMNEVSLDSQVVSMAEVKVNKERGILLAQSNGAVLVVAELQIFGVMDMRSDHIGEVSHVLVSLCGKYVMTGGKDCLLMVYTLNLLIQGELQAQQTASITVDDFLADVVLIKKEEIQEVAAKEKLFSLAIGQLSKKLKLSYEERLRKHQKNMQEVELHKNRVIEDLIYRIDREKAQIEKIKSDNSAAINELNQTNLKRAEELQQKYEQKIHFQVQKYFQLEQQLIQFKIVHRKQMQKLRLNEQQRIKALKKQFEEKLKQSHQIYSTSRKEADFATSLFEERMRHIEQEQEEEVQDVSAKKTEFRTEASSMLQDLQQKQLKWKKQHLKLTMKREQERARYKQQTGICKKVQKELEEAKEKLKDMTQNFEQKENIIKSKEKRIQQFEQKIENLLKTKHILSYKGTEMKKAIEPKEVQIDKLKVDLIKLKKEFEVSLERRQKGLLLMEKNQKERKNIEKNLEAEEAQTHKQVALLEQIVTDIYNCIETSGKQDGKVYYKEAVKLYHRYVEKNDKFDSTIDPKGVEEMTKQIVHLEKSLFQINKANDKVILRKNEEIFKRTKENAELVNNLNEFKKENKELVLKIKLKKEEVDKLRTHKMSLLGECKSIDPNIYKAFAKDGVDGDEGKPKAIIKHTASVKRLSHQQIDTKVGFQKVECQLHSEIQFAHQKEHRLDFTIRTMQENIKKHISLKKCDLELSQDREI